MIQQNLGAVEELNSTAAELSQHAEDLQTMIAGLKVDDGESRGAPVGAIGKREPANASQAFSLAQCDGQRAEAAAAGAR